MFCPEKSLQQVNYQTPLIVHFLSQYNVKMRSRQRNKKKNKKDKIVHTKTSNELEQARTS